MNGLSQVRVIGVKAGGEHSLAVTDSGGLYSWGNGDIGQLGHGDSRQQSARPSWWRLFGTSR